MTKILCITSSKLKSLMNKERFDLYDAIIKKKSIIHDVEKDENYDFDLIKLITNLEKKHGKFSGIIFEEPVWNIKLGFNTIFKNCEKVRIPKATFLTDYWINRKYLIKYLKKNDINNIICTHQTAYPFIKKYLSFIENILYIPFCIKKDSFPKKIVKKTDILNAGVIHHVTPFRNRLYSLLNKLAPEIKYEYLDHPGKRKTNKKKIVGKNYIKKISESYFTIATTTSFNLSVRKYYEIMAAGTTIIGNHTNLPEHDIIKKNMVYISNDMSDKEILGIIKKAVKNKKEYYKKALKLRREIIEYASSDKVAEKIINFFKSDNVIVSNNMKNKKIPFDYNIFLLKIDSIIKFICKKINIKYKGLIR